MLPRVLLALLTALVILALGLLVWLLVSPGSPLAAPEPTPTAAPTAEPTASPSPTPSPSPSPEPTPSPTPEPTPIPVELGETEDMGQEYIDRIVFLGDSTTYGLGAYGVLPFTQIWTDASGTLALFNWAIDSINYYDPASPYSAQSLSITDCAARRQPEYLIITLGINGVAMLDETDFKDYYTSLIDAILAVSPDTKIICHSIYPVIDAQTPGGIDNSRVNAANQWIYDVAEATGTRYLNSHDRLMDGQGGLDPSYNNGDGMGIHLNTDGFAIVLDNIRTHGWQ